MPGTASNSRLKESHEFTRLLLEGKIFAIGSTGFMDWRAVTPGCGPRIEVFARQILDSLPPGVTVTEHVAIDPSFCRSVIVCHLRKKLAQATGGKCVSPSRLNRWR